MEGRRDQRVAAETEDDPGRVRRAQASEAGPRRIEGHLGIGEQPGDPVAHEHAEHGPDHGEDDARLARIVVVVRAPLAARLGRVVAGDHHEDHGDAGQHDDHAMDAERVVAAGRRHRQAAQAQDGQYDEGKLPLGGCQLRDHVALALICRGPGTLTSRWSAPEMPWLTSGKRMRQPTSAPTVASRVTPQPGPGIANLPSASRPGGQNEPSLSDRYPLFSSLPIIAASAVGPRLFSAGYLGQLEHHAAAVRYAPGPILTCFSRKPRALLFDLSWQG